MVDKIKGNSYPYSKYYDMPDFFALYKNYAIFVALQTWALLGASLAMRMPSPWSSEITPNATRSVGLFGLIRASGYEPDDPENDLLF